MSEFQMYVKKPIPIKVKQMNKDFSVESLEGIMSGKKEYMQCNGKVF